MAKQKRGWIKLYRKSEDNPMYFSEPFDKWHAWQDLLLMANHEQKQIFNRGQLVTVDAGMLLTSIKILSERWRWSTNKVRRYLCALNGTGMCKINGTPNGTAITIVNWALYQDGRQTNGTPNGTTDGVSNESTDGTLTRSNKNYKKKERSPRPSDDELFAALIERERSRGSEA